jgi:membrane-associated phospholipid phosphatase
VSGDVVQAVAILLVVGWAAILVRFRLVRSGRAAGWSPPTRAVAGTGVATVLLAAASSIADRIADAGLGPTALDATVRAFALDHRTGPLTVVSDVLDGVAGTVAMGALAVAAAGLLWRRHRFEAGLVLAAAAVGAALVAGLKLVYARPRPPMTGWLITESGFSLPSGHALGATVVVGVVVVVSWSVMSRGPARVTVLGFGALFVLATGASRVYLGVHWTTDVLEGWMFGSACIALCIVALAVHRRGPATLRTDPALLSTSGGNAPGAGEPPRRAAA